VSSLLVLIRHHCATLVGVVIDRRIRDGVLVSAHARPDTAASNSTLVASGTNCGQFLYYFAVGAQGLVADFARWDPLPAAATAPEPGCITGEQPQSATGIAWGADCSSGFGSRAAVGSAAAVLSSAAGLGSAAAVLSLASRCRDGSRTTATITPKPSIAARVRQPGDVSSARH
jgi:hypothetical protein